MPAKEQFKTKTSDRCINESSENVKTLRRFIFLLGK